MSIKRVAIQSDVTLEGLMHEGGESGGVVVCHPHPLSGGSMHNNVVEAIEEGFHRNGFTTLRFNFRGVGTSGGHYDEGTGESRDVLAACGFVREHMSGDVPLLLAGYSFGAWVAVRSASAAGAAGLFLVAYPFSFYEPDTLKAFRKPLYFVGGSADEISPLDDLLALYGELETEKYLKVVPSSHFFAGQERAIAEFIDRLFARPAKR